MPRADQDTLREAIRGSRLLVHDGTGHTPHWEEPARFVADLVAFVEVLGLTSRACGTILMYGRGARQPSGYDMILCVAQP